MQVRRLSKSTTDSKWPELNLRILFKPQQNYSMHTMLGKGTTRKLRMPAVTSSPFGMCLQAERNPRDFQREIRTASYQ